MSLVTLPKRQQQSTRMNAGVTTATILAWCVFGFLFALIWQSAVALF